MKRDSRRRRSLTLTAHVRYASDSDQIADMLRMMLRAPRPKLTDNPMRPGETDTVSGVGRCGARTNGAPQGARNGNYKHGRYTKEVAATRQCLREATHMLRDLNKRPG